MTLSLIRQLRLKYCWDHLSSQVVCSRRQDLRCGLPTVFDTIFGFILFGPIDHNPCGPDSVGRVVSFIPNKVYDH